MERAVGDHKILRLVRLITCPLVTEAELHEEQIVLQ
jgi:hypothetical protein